MSGWGDYLTTGIKVPDGDLVPVRKEIRDLSDVEMYLYLEGLAKFQKDDIEEPSSYFQIAGIHGRPYVAWPNKPWNTDIPTRKWNEQDPNDSGGFCAHTSILFLTWHRPYLSLFEAALYNHVNEIANNIDADAATKEQYVNAAKTFRIPYWDWARNRDVSSVAPPEATDKEKLPVGPPSSVSVNPTTNPLYEYQFPDGVDAIDDKIRNGHLTTVRYPDADDPDMALQKAFNKFAATRKQYDWYKPGKNLTERIVYILQSYLRFAPMSNNQYNPHDIDQKTANAEIWGSIEDVHNAVHNLAGGGNDGGGHMGDVAIAAFDPIFWLHHANIDRMYALWQALHETGKKDQTWITNQITTDGSITHPPKQEETENDPLYPFQGSVKSWYKSEDVRRTEHFGYAYPETQGLTYPTDNAVRQKLKQTIDEYYAPPASMIQNSIMGDETAGDFLLPRAELLKKLADQENAATVAAVAQLIPELPELQNLLQVSLQPGKPFLKDLAPDKSYLEWLVNIKAQKHSLGGNFAVHIFLGDVDEGSDVSLWPTSPYYVGAFIPLGQSSNTGCAKCQDDQQNQVQITGQIPLTIALIERYLAQLIPNLDATNVVPYLQQDLHWRVESNGAVLDNRAQLDGLTVFVVSNKVTLPQDPSEFPTYAEDVTIYPEVTTNRNGMGRGDGTGLIVGEQ